MNDQQPHVPEALKRYMGNDEFARLCNIELLSAGPGHAHAKMVLGPQHRNGFGVTQGGAIFTVADFAFAAASNAHGTVAVATNVNITFMKAATTGTLWAGAKENSKNPKLDSYTIEVKVIKGTWLRCSRGSCTGRKSRYPSEGGARGVHWPRPRARSPVRAGSRTAVRGRPCVRKRTRFPLKPPVPFPPPSFEYRPAN